MGGWHLSDEPVEDEVRELLWNAINGDNEGYNIVEIMGTQVVAGMNYKLFCSKTNKDGYLNEWTILTVYVDLEGNASVINVEPVEISAFETAE